MAAQLVAGLPGGILIDKLDKRRLMLACDAVRAAGQAGLVAVIAWHRASLGAVVAAIVIDNAVSAVFNAAEPTAVRHVVDAEQLPAAIARLQARDAAAMLGGPPLGGLLFAVAPGLPFGFNCASYLVSLTCLAAIRAPMAAAAAGDEPRGLRTILLGLSWIWQQPFMRVTVMLISVSNLVSNSLILIAIVESRQRGDPGTVTGLLVTLASAGSLAGALVAPWLVRVLSLRVILIANRCLWAVLVPLFLVITNTYLLGAVIGLMFFMGPTGSTAVISRQMAATPEHMQGRASSARSFGTGLAAPAGTAITGYALAHFGPSASILGLTALLLAMAVLAASSRSLRTVPSGLTGQSADSPGPVAGGTTAAR